MKMKNKSPVLLLLGILVVVLVLGMVLGFSGNRKEGLVNTIPYNNNNTNNKPTTPYNNNNNSNQGCKPDPGNAVSGYNKYYFTDGKLNDKGQQCLITTDYINYSKMTAPLSKCDPDLRKKLTDAQKKGT